MEARKAMIVWRGTRGDETGKPPEVRIYDMDDQASFRRYHHLPCSLGACLHDWCAESALADMTRVFLAVAEDGVPLADIHREFLKVDEWAALTGGREFFGVEMVEPEDA